MMIMGTGNKNTKNENKQQQQHSLKQVHETLNNISRRFEGNVPNNLRENRDGEPSSGVLSGVKRRLLQDKDSNTLANSYDTAKKQRTDVLPGTRDQSVVLARNVQPQPNLTLDYSNPNPDSNHDKVVADTAVSSPRGSVFTRTRSHVNSRSTPPNTELTKQDVSGSKQMVVETTSKFERPQSAAQPAARPAATFRENTTPIHSQKQISNNGMRDAISSAPYSQNKSTGPLSQVNTTNTATVTQSLFNMSTPSESSDSSRSTFQRTTQAPNVTRTKFVSRYKRKLEPQSQAQSQAQPQAHSQPHPHSQSYPQLQTNPQLHQLQPQPQLYQLQGPPQTQSLSQVQQGHMLQFNEPLLHPTLMNPLPPVYQQKRQLQVRQPQNHSIIQPLALQTKYSVIQPQPATPVRNSPAPLYQSLAQQSPHPVGNNQPQPFQMAGRRQVNFSTPPHAQAQYSSQIPAPPQQLPPRPLVYSQQYPTTIIGQGVPQPPQQSQIGSPPPPSGSSSSGQARSLPTNNRTNNLRQLHTPLQRIGPQRTGPQRTGPQHTGPHHKQLQMSRRPQQYKNIPSSYKQYSTPLATTQNFGSTSRQQQEEDVVNTENTNDTKKSIHDSARAMLIYIESATRMFDRDRIDEKFLMKELEIGESELKELLKEYHLWKSMRDDDGDFAGRKLTGTLDRKILSYCDALHSKGIEVTNLRLENIGLVPTVAQRVVRHFHANRHRRQYNARKTQRSTPRPKNQLQIDAPKNMVPSSTSSAKASSSTVPAGPSSTNALPSVAPSSSSSSSAQNGGDDDVPSQDTMDSILASLPSPESFSASINTSEEAPSTSAANESLSTCDSPKAEGPTSSSSYRPKNAEALREEDTGAESDFASPLAQKTFASIEREIAQTRRKIKCKYCDKSFLSRKLFQNHLKKHSPPKRTKQKSSPNSKPSAPTSTASRTPRRSWSFYQGYDSPGNDIICHDQLNLKQLKRACVELKAVGFNTNGWIKDKILVPSRWCRWSTSPKEGLWVLEEE